MKVTKEEWRRSGRPVVLALIFKIFLCVISIISIFFIGASIAPQSSINPPLTVTSIDSSYLMMILMLTLLVIGGWITVQVLHLNGIWRILKLVNNNDSQAMGKVFNGYLTYVISSFFVKIPYVGLAAGLAALIACIVMLRGFYELKDSATFPDRARKGAGIQFTVGIISIILLVVIKLLSSWTAFVILAAVCLIICFIFDFYSWYLISTADPEDVEEKITETVSSEDII